MAQRRLVLALVALLTIAALGFVATGIDDVSGSKGSGAGDGATGSGGQSSGDSGSETVAAVLVVVLLALAVGAVSYATYRDSIPRWLVAVLLLSAVVLLALIGLGQVLDPADTGGVVPGERSAAETPDPVATPTPGAPESGAEPGPLSTTAVMVLLGVLLLGGALVVTRFSRGAPDESEPEADDDPAAVAAAAGRAADELGETTLSNAVFRAWQEMTDALDVENPGTTTPAQFEDIAVDAGLDREDVATLTDLFREVRYGDAPATADREERARTALRRIEATYAAGDENGDPDRGGGPQ